VQTPAAGAASNTANLTVVAAAGYLVGDVYPHPGDESPNFGDGAMNILDLVQELFAVNNVPGYRPASCTDRFDAMDLFPVDSGGTRGGDGLLDIRDLIRELFRVNNLDNARPVRTPRGLACGSSSPISERPASAGAVEATLAMGPAEATADGERVPVYLEARSNLARVAVTFALGDEVSQLRFVASPATPPSLAEDNQRGAVAVAWFDGLSVRAGARLLLGYVSGPAGVSSKLRLYGMSAVRVDDNLEVRLAAAF